MRNALRLSAAALLVLVLGACGDEAAPAATAPVKPKAVVAPQTPAVALAADVAYSYDPVGKRDPFRSPVEEAGPKDGGANQPCSEPLCQWELDQLTLVAIVTGDSNPMGMVEDPQGRGYIIHRNTKIGRRGGKVTQIMRGSVTVTELWAQSDGKVQPSPKTLALKADKQMTPELDLSTGTTFQ